MKRIICGLTLTMMAATSANAALLGRRAATLGGDDHQAYYDTELNITWLADANYAQTSSYDADGLMTYSKAQTWIESLNDSNYLGVNDWRLPRLIDTGGYGCNWQWSGTDCGYNVLTKVGSTVYSELAYMFFETLGNLSHLAPDKTLQPGYGLENTDPFSNIVEASYWSGPAYALPNSQWVFNFTWGAQEVDDKYSERYAWAVRNGDILDVITLPPEPNPVPVPSAVWLFGTGLAALAGIKRRTRSSRTGA